MKTKRLVGLVLCLAMMLSFATFASATETTEAIPYTAKAQGTLQNVAAAKPVTVTSAAWAEDDSITIQHTGGYLNDESLNTWWESKPDGEGNYQAGEYAIIDLTRQYEIYRIELQFASSATNTPATNVTASQNEAKSWEVYGSNDKFTVAAYEKLGTFGTDDMSIDTQRSLDLYGKKYRYIKIVKTSAEVARLYEVKVFGVEPAMIDVTPTADKIWTNKTNTDYHVDRLVDGKLNTFFHGPAPDNDNLRFTLDLGAEYKVRRVEIRFREGGVTAGAGESRSRKNFRIWAGNATDNTVDFFDTEDGYEIFRVDYHTSPASNSVSYEGTIANGGQTLYFDSTSNEATRFVSMEWTSKAYGNAFSLAEIKVWAEDETTKEMKLSDVSTELQDVNAKTYSMDLGAYYNIKQVEVIPASGTTLENFYVYGDAGNKMASAPVSHKSMSAFLAQQTDAISESTKYDVQSFNMVRFITLQSKTNITEAPVVKVYAEDGVSYENKALSKTVTGTKNFSNPQQLTNGVVYNVSPAEINMNASTDMIMVDLGVKKKIEGFALNSAYIGKRNPSVSSGYIIWGANSSDFSDKIMLFKDDLRSMRMTFGGDMHPVNKTGKYRYIGISYPAVGVSVGSEEYIYTIAAHAKLGTNSNLRNSILLGDNKLTHATPSEYRKNWSELMVFTEVQATVEAGYDKTDAVTEGLTDDLTTGASVDLATSPVVKLDRAYPIYSVSLGSAATVATTVSASLDGVDYTTLGTIAAGSTTLEIDNPDNFYRYVKFSGESAEVYEVEVLTYEKYGLGAITVESCEFNNGTPGSVIEDLTAANLGATVVVRNTGSEDKSAVMIVALYDENNMLIDLNYVSPAENGGKIPANGGTATLSTSVTKSGTPAMLKVLIWESLGNLNPLADSETLQ